MTFSNIVPVVHQNWNSSSSWLWFESWCSFETRGQRPWRSPTSGRCRSQLADFKRSSQGFQWGPKIPAKTLIEHWQGNRLSLNHSLKRSKGTQDLKDQWDTFTGYYKKFHPRIWLNAGIDQSEKLKLVTWLNDWSDSSEESNFTLKYIL